MSQPKYYTPAEQGRSLTEMIDRALKTPLRTVDPEDNPAFRQKIKHVLLPNERLMEFVARVGLGVAQALTMSEEEITLFVDRAMQRRADDPVEAGGWNRKLEIPKRFSI
jgi:hypothetical protein